MTDTIYLPENATDKDIATAIASLTSGGTVVLPENADITVTAPIVVRVDAQDIAIDLNGSTLTTTGNFAAIDVYGQEKTLEGVTLGTDTAGNATITYDSLPEGIEVGSWLKVVSDDALPGDHVDGSDNGLYTNLGQAAQVIAIDGNTVVLDGSLLEQELYTTNVRAGLYAEGSISVTNGHLAGQFTEVTSSGQPLLRVRSLTDTSISDISVQNAGNGITLVNNVNAEVTDVSGSYVHSVVQSATSLNTSINGLFAEHVNHGVLVHTTGTATNAASTSNYGADIQLVATNSVVYDAALAAYDFHSESRDGLYTDVLAFESRMFGDLRGIGNTFSDSAGAGNTYGVQFYEYGDGDGRDATVDNLTLRETTKYSFIISGKPLGNVVTDSSFESYGKGYSISPSAVEFINTTVEENVVGDDDTLTGTSADDKLLGGQGLDALFGGDGNDYLWGGTGADTLEGNDGRDRFAYNALDEGGDLITDFKTGDGGDVIDVSVLGIRLGWDQEDYLAGGLVQVVQSGTDALVQARDDDNGWTTLATLDNVLASSFTAANLQVKLSDPLPEVETPSTHIYGTSAAEWLYGSAGADIFHGSAGNDSYIFNNAMDRVAGDTDDGIDSVWAYVGVDLRGSNEIENIRLKEDAGGATVFGNDAANLITGNSHSNTIVGGLGVDSLYGKGGADTFVFAEAGKDNADSVWDYSDDDRIALESRFFTGLDKDGDGVLDQDAFTFGTAATIDGPQMIYNNTTGKLYYDGDGTGGNAPELVVNLPTAKSYFDIGHIILL